MERLAVLIVAATSAEIAPAVAAFSPGGPVAPRLCRYGFRRLSVDVLITGAGMVPTAAWASRALATTRYDLALNFGVCGSFDPATPPGAVVHVISDCFGELGAEDGDRFLPLDELGLDGEVRVVNEAPPANAALGALPVVTGITVNTVHGNARTIAAVVERFNPQVESMEGAAFMYACRVHDVAFAQVRAVSNLVERRNRAAWKLSDAIANLGTAAIDILSAS